MAIVNKTDKIYKNQTVKFSMTSSQGNKYVLIMYVYYDKNILEEPLKGRSGSHILEVYTNQVKHLTNRVHIPRVHWLDNESSASLKKYNQQEDIE